MCTCSLDDHWMRHDDVGDDGDAMDFRERTADRMQVTCAWQQPEDVSARSAETAAGFVWERTCSAWVSLPYRERASLREIGISKICDRRVNVRDKRVRMPYEQTNERGVR
jgi:hypothetical protein